MRIWCCNADKWIYKSVNGVEFTTLEQCSVGEPEKRHLTYFTFLGEGGGEAGREAFGENAPSAVRSGSAPCEATASPEVEEIGDCAGCDPEIPINAASRYRAEPRSEGVFISQEPPTLEEFVGCVRAPRRPAVSFGKNPSAKPLEVSFAVENTLKLNEILSSPRASASQTNRKSSSKRARMVLTVSTGWESRIPLRVGKLSFKDVSGEKKTTHRQTDTHTHIYISVQMYIPELKNKKIKKGN